MCCWLAYTGSPILLTQVLYTQVHSLIDQSLHSRLGAETTNGDGFGVGWYDATPVPGVCSTWRSPSAWRGRSAGCWRAPSPSMPTGSPATQSSSKMQSGSVAAIRVRAYAYPPSFGAAPGRSLSPGTATHNDQSVPPADHSCRGEISGSHGVCRVQLSVRVRGLTLVPETDVRSAVWMRPIRIWPTARSVLLLP